MQKSYDPSVDITIKGHAWRCCGLDYTSQVYGARAVFTCRLCETTVHENDLDKLPSCNLVIAQKVISK
jgi:hypothetical protein